MIHTWSPHTFVHTYTYTHGKKINVIKKFKNECCSNTKLWKYLFYRLQGWNFHWTAQIELRTSWSHRRLKTAILLCTQPVRLTCFQEDNETLTLLALGFPCNQLLQCKLMPAVISNCVLFYALTRNSAFVPFADSSKSRGGTQSSNNEYLL